jgi:hypothetical protein
VTPAAPTPVVPVDGARAAGRPARGAHGVRSLAGRLPDAAGGARLSVARALR